MPADTPDYSQHIAELQQWLKKVFTDPSTPELRAWYIPDNMQAEAISNGNITSNFDDSQANNDFQTEYDNVKSSGFTGNPVLYLQAESDHINGLAKMFIYRHQPRLKNYRDDFENKRYRTYSALSISLAKYAMLKHNV
jgi:hypothetical protein